MLPHVHGAALVGRPQAEKVHILIFFINMHARIYLLIQHSCCTQLTDGHNGRTLHVGQI